MKVSNHLALYLGGLSAVALSLVAPSAKAQEFGREVCREIGPSPSSPSAIGKATQGFCACRSELFHLLPQGFLAQDEKCRPFCLEIWSGLRDSNPQSEPWHTSAYPCLRERRS
jgi:hypothetical protein